MLLLPFYIQCVLVVLFSLIVGSFITMVVHRLPLMLLPNQDYLADETLDHATVSGKNISLLYPRRSYCPHCHKTIPWYLNLPLVSFIWLGGRCKSCQQLIAFRYFLIESISLITGLGVFILYGSTYQAYGLMLLGWALLTLAFIDLKHYILPDQITLPLLWLGLLTNACNLYVPANEAIWGAAWGYLSLWAIYWLYFLLRGKEGLGFGDFKLLAVAGAWGGWAMILPALFLASLSALLCNLPLLINGDQQKIPFGPYLAFSSWLLLVFPEWQNFFYFSI